jgi:hypothetical protein
MNDKNTNDKNAKHKDPKGENTSGGGHLGGTNFGQAADAKTTSTRDAGGDKARPNDGRN